MFCSLFVTVLCCFSTYYMYSWCYSVFFREYVSNSYHRIFCPFYTRFISCICKYSNRSRLFHTPSLKFLNTKITPISFISKHGFKIISYRLTCSYYIIYKHYSIFNLLFYFLHSLPLLNIHSPSIIQTTHLYPHYHMVLFRSTHMGNQYITDLFLLNARPSHYY